MVNNPIKEIKSTKLWKYLKEIDKEYADKVLLFINKISSLLSSIKNYFPYYTRHDAHHGFEVVKRMAEIVNPDCLKKDLELSFIPEEVFLLICSAYGHDLGMTIFPNEKIGLLESLDIIEEKAWETNSKLTDYLRKNHSSRGGKYIKDFYEEIGVPLSLVALLDKLMMAYNLSINELDSQLGSRRAAGGIEIDLKQLACILCIADALEFSDARVVDGVLNVLEEKIKDKSDKSALISYYENMKHVCIGNDVAVSKKDGKIIFSGTFQQPEILNLAHQTIDLIEVWVRDYCDIDYSSEKKRLRLRSDSIVRTLESDFDFTRIGVRIKKENIIGLISSTATWTNDPAMVIRELLQNSVEACRYRESNSNKKYIPDIELFFDYENRKITITDNGCGMSRNIILNNFLTVGNSRSLDPTYSSNDYHSLARFGIGFWSVFTIAQKARIKTAPFEYLTHDNFLDEVSSLEFEVSIDEFKDYTVFNKANGKIGTTIILDILDTIRMHDIPSRLNYHISCSEIPIKIKTNSEEYIISTNLVLPTFNQIFTPKHDHAKELGIDIFYHEDLSDELDFKLYITYRNSGIVTFLLPDNINPINSLLYFMGATKLSRISVCGFNANFFHRTFCLNIDGVGGFMINKKNPKGISFTLNRNAIMNSPESEKFNDSISLLLHNGYKAFLQKTNSYNSENIYRLNQESSQSSSRPPYFEAIKDLEFFRKNFPELICFKFYKIQQGKSIKTCETIYCNLITLKNQNIKAISLYYQPLFTLKTGIRISDNLAYAYQLFANDPSFHNFYLQDNGYERGIIIEKNSDCKIRFLDVIIGSIELQLPFSIVNLSFIDLDLEKKDFIGVVQGQFWAGSIFKKQIEGNNFAFIDHQCIIVQENSILLNDINDLYKKGEYNNLGFLISRLSQTIEGFIDETVKKYV